MLLKLVTFTIILAKCDISENFRLAVVEYRPFFNRSLSFSKNLEKNTDNYLKLIKSAKQLDLIVFPEDTLTFGASPAKIQNYIPFVDIRSNPCENATFPEFIRQLSCISRTLNTTLIINIVEKSKCNPEKEKTRNCQKYHLNFYNTDIIFSNTGKIIAKYRKFNLFGEFDKDRPTKAELIVFSVNNRTFGIFTCFDILFRQPTLQLLQYARKFIYPTFWFSELPFLTSLQTQQMWAEKNDVWLFSAGANNPLKGSGGTGAFLGAKGPAFQDFANDSKMYIYDSSVPTRGDSKSVDFLAKEMDQFHLLSENLSGFASVPLDTRDGAFGADLCHNGLCCTLGAKVRDSGGKGLKYTYLFVVFAGVRTFSHVYNGGIEVCGLVACLGDTLESCGRRFRHYEDISWPYTFENVEIEGNFTNSKEKIQFPNSLLSSIRPIHPNETKWQEEIGKEFIWRKFSLKKPQNRLLTFAIYGRNFGNDSNPFDNSPTLPFVTNL